MEKTMNRNLQKYYELYSELKESELEKIPLCAAETYVSDFCKSALISDFEGKYAFPDSFIGGEFVERLNAILSDECKKLFHAQYSNADTLTGINCFTVCAMSLLPRSDCVLVTTPEQGGHASIPIILDTLGIKYESLPYNYEEYQIDYNRTNYLCSTGKYSFIIFCQSDIINPPDLSKITLEKVGVIYDATQTLGLIASNIIQNPLDVHNNIVLIGGTHKTLPSPSCGLIMTNNSKYEDNLKNNITPHYLRNTQPNHIAALLLSLIEQEERGFEYQTHVVQLANILGKELTDYGFIVANVTHGIYTYTHQLFLLMSENDMESIFYNAKKYNISLNKKNKLLFRNYGIRLGTQQIARYNWQSEDIKCLAQLLYCIKQDDSFDTINRLRKILIEKKQPQFTFENSIIE